MINIENILFYFPKDLSKKIIEMNIDFNYLEEIRIRVNRKVILKVGKKEYLIDRIIDSKEILDILTNLCDNSIYTYQDEICKGFITIKGGHRVGIVGSCVIKDGKVININYISGLNFRIAKEVIDCSKKILKYVINIEENTIFNTLIASPPGVRKNNYCKRFNKKNK